MPLLPRFVVDAQASTISYHLQEDPESWLPAAIPFQVAPQTLLRICRDAASPGRSALLAETCRDPYYTVAWYSLQRYNITRSNEALHG